MRLLNLILEIVKFVITLGFYYEVLFFGGHFINGIFGYKEDFGIQEFRHSSRHYKKNSGIDVQLIL
jgi:hypothetical protein